VAQWSSIGGLARLSHRFARFVLFQSRVSCSKLEMHAEMCSSFCQGFSTAQSEPSASTSERLARRSGINIGDLSSLGSLHTAMTRRNEMFGRLLKAGISSIANIEGKTAPIVEEDLGQQIGLAGYTIQRYKAGNIPPDIRTVEILAQACVRRGLLGRSWLERFLQTAQYPAPDSVLDQLCPATPARLRAPRVYENLPAPTYSQFVMREQTFVEVVDGLKQRSAVVLVVGLGGNGKTSLVREVAWHCLAGTGDAPLFDAAVWVSDQDRPGTINHSIVLDEIARTLDYPGLTQFAHEEKQREVEQLLKRQKVLLIVDNFETITDGALLAWLLHLPEPSKALITTRTRRRDFWSSWLVELRGMSEREAQQLIVQRLRALQLHKFIDDRTSFEPLIAVTGGNPKALEIALGLIKYSHRALPQIVDDLAAAHHPLFDDLFAHAWSLLDEQAHRVLMALTFFPASASSQALGATADVQGFVFDSALERLADLGLIDVQQLDLNRPPRYTLHPLVRAFAAAQLANHPSVADRARDRWVAWYLQLADQVGFCWRDLGRLELLDSEHETMQAAIGWTFEHKRYAEAIQLIEGVRYYYNVRGLWDERLSINRMRAEAARRLGDRANEALALAHHIEIRSKQGNLAEAQECLAQLEAVVRDAQLPDDVTFEVQHAGAHYARAQGDLALAEQRWRELLDLSVRLGGQKYVVNRRWLATCLAQQGRLPEAEPLYQESLRDAVRIGDQRSITGNTIELAAITLEQGHLERAEADLATCYATAQQYHDRRRMGEIQRLLARIRILRGDVPAAHAALTSAADLFERMGMRRELDEAQHALQQLREQMLTAQE
jgi:tetratricopeptide (TPR) repeat protein